MAGIAVARFLTATKIISAKPFRGDGVGNEELIG
jgi:hypothetical protein